MGWRALPVAVLALASAVAPACRPGPAAASGSSLAVAADSDWRGPALAAFELVERSGRRVRLADLAGHPFVLDFVFTTCSGPCPRMERGMRRLQDELAHTSVRLVSVSVDPARDDPETLARYADGFGADPDRWWFLTGDEGAIHDLAASVSLAVQRAPDGEAVLGTQVAHSTRLVVVGPDGVVRGYYDGTVDGGIRAAAARARELDGGR